MGARLCPQPDGGRVETGAVQFGSDWPGLFIRGDTAAYLAMLIRSLLAEGESPEPLSFMLTRSNLKAIADLIETDVIAKPGDRK